MEQTTKPELIELYKEFQSKWPRERIASMSLEEYTKLGGKDSFCYWMEGKLSQWGSIWGGASSKFGIYEHSKNPKVDVRLCIDDQYSWYKKYGTDRNEVFEKIRKMILSIIDAVQTNQLELIDKIDMGDAYKWKIAFHYQLDIENPTLVPIYKKEWLCKLTNKPSRTEISALQKELIGKKPEGQSVKNYSEDLGKTLWGVPHYWIYAPGENANMWQDCLDKGIMSIGWDDMDDLADYKSKEDIKKAMQQVYQKDSSFRNDGLCCWEFANVLKEGDIIFAKNGSSKIIGRGVVTSDYRYEPERARYTHIRGVDWTNVGEWNHDTSKIVLKTLTDITKYKEYTQRLEELVKGINKEIIDMVGIKEKFFDFLKSCVRSTGKSEVLSEEASKNYVNYLDPSKLFDYAPSKWSHITSIFDILDIDTVVNLYNDLMADEDFKFQDNRRFRQTALGHYITFLRSNKYFTHTNTLEQAPNDVMVDVTKYGNYIQLLKEQHNIILTGAPGTGKTYLAKAIAKAMNAEVGFVQFHPSYDYTDFVEGLRPNQETEGSMGFERQDGIFKAFCSQALKNWLDAQKSKDDQNRETIAFRAVNEYLADCAENNIELRTITKGRTFYIYDANEKSIKIRIPGNEKANDIRVSRQELIDLLVARPKIYSGSDTCAFFNRQFRTQGDTYLASIYSVIVHKIKDETADIAPVTKKDFVFIIDEINRGEINKIFGELFFSLDPGYRGQAGLVQTQYQRLVPQDDLFYKGFYVPENVYIIGTMNDIDRSVESMDFAMRRRFTWVEVKPMDNAEMLEGATWSEEAKERMVSLNKEISQTEGLGEAFQVGPSYFKKLATNGANFTTLWNMNIKPLLQEYLRGFRDATNTLAKFEAAYNRQSNDSQQEATEVVVEEAE